MKTHNMIAICIVLLLASSNAFLYAQQSKSEKNEEAASSTESATGESTATSAEPKGNWLLTQTAATVGLSAELKEKRLEDFAQLLNAQLEDEITPQAFDRNLNGEILLVSQTTPPADKIIQWAYVAYKTEEEMLADLEEKSKNRIYPTGFDVQDDGAYVLYAKVALSLIKFRLIKVDSIESFQSSVQVYWELGLIPVALSSYINSLWIMYAEFVEIDTSKYSLEIKSSSLPKVGETLERVLAEEKTQLLAFTSTSQNKALMIFMTPQE